MFETILGILIGGGLLGLSIVILLTILAGAFIWYIFLAVGYWNIFRKAGEIPWKALIPFYNTYTRYQISWSTSMFWLSILLNVINGLIPEDARFILATLSLVLSIAGLVISAKSCMKLAESFGHGVGFAVGLFFLEPIFVLILGLDDSKYIGNPA